MNIHLHNQRRASDAKIIEYDKVEMNYGKEST